MQFTLAIVLAFLAAVSHAQLDTCDGCLATMETLTTAATTPESIAVSSVAQLGFMSNLLEVPNLFVPYPYSNALFTTQDTYGICLNMGTLCRVSHIGCPYQYQSMEILINSLHPNNAIQLTLYINQYSQYFKKLSPCLFEVTLNVMKRNSQNLSVRPYSILPAEQGSNPIKPILAKITLKTD